jgi:recombination protein RecT
MSTKREDLKNQIATQAANAGGAVDKPKTPVSHGIKALMATDAVKNRFDEVLKAKAPQFMASIINLVNTTPELQQADGMSVIQSAMVAAALDLPVDKNLGYMWIIARADRNRGGMKFASPQLGYKGYIQLALRTGQYAAINVIDIYEGELVSFNRLSEKLELDFDSKKSDAIIGYAAHFELLNGFKKTVYWSKERVEKHKARFSKTDKLWNTDWDAMARKTVLKAMLSQWGILSIEMQKAFSEDREEVGEGAEMPGTPLSDPMEYDPNAYIHTDGNEVNRETGEIVENEGAANEG